MLQVCLFRCCICFTHMLQVFYMDVAYVLVLQCFSCVFASVSDICFKCFICLQTYVVNVAFGCSKSRLCVASPSLLSAASSQCLLLLPAPAGICRLVLLFSMLVTFWAAWNPVWVHATAVVAGVRTPRPFGRSGASKPLVLYMGKLGCKLARDD
jgi:hypothetical protein